MGGDSRPRRAAGHLVSACHLGFRGRAQRHPVGSPDVFGHDGDSLSVDGTQISIFKQTHQVRFASLLQRADGGTLEPQVGFEILGDLPHQPLERQFPDQKLGGFLVTTDFSKRNSPGPVAMRFFHPASRGVQRPRSGVPPVLTLNRGMRT